MEKRALNLAAFAAAVILLSSVVAFADDVEITSYYPLPYGEYKRSAAQTIVTGATGITPDTEVNGDITVNGNVTIKDCLLRVAPDLGPYNHDALKVTASGDVSIGDNSQVTSEPARFRAHTVIGGREMYALDYDSGLPEKKYGLMHGFVDPAQAGLLQKKAQFAAKLDNLTPTNFADDVLYAPMRVDGHYVRFGEKMADRPTYTASGGDMNNVLIGTQTLDIAGLTVPPDRVFLQVGNPGDGTEARGDFTTFSSREFKKDIVPFGRPDLDAALKSVQSAKVVRYHLKADKPDERLRLGLIAEEAPAEMVSADRRAIPLSDAMGHLAAAMKALQARNEELKLRISELEKKKAALERS